MSAGNKLAAWALWVLGLAISSLALLMTVSLALEAGVIAARGYWPLLGQTLVSWRLFLLASILAVAALLWRLSSRTQAADQIRRRWWLWIPVWAVVAAALLLAPAWMPEANALAVVASKPNHQSWNDVGHPTRPPAWVITNELGFRDAPWTAARGEDRVVVIGDSYVFGAGVPEPDGLIHRQLERELATLAPTRSWAVMNAGCPGWGYFTYFELAARVVKQVHPRAVVIGTLNTSDWTLFDRQQLIDLLGRRGFTFARRLGLADHLIEESILYSQPLPNLSLSPQTFAGLERLTGIVDELLATTDQAGIPVIVWEYYEHFEFFDRFLTHPSLHLASWPPSFDRRWDGWGSDPTLSIPGDHHPTAKANAIVAAELAPQILKYLEPSGAAPTTAPQNEPGVQSP